MTFFLQFNSTVTSNGLIFFKYLSLSVLVSDVDYKINYTQLSNKYSYYLN